MSQEHPFAKVMVKLPSGDLGYISSDDALLASHFQGVTVVPDPDNASIYTEYRAGVLSIMLTSLQVVRETQLIPITFNEWLEAPK